MQGTPSKIVASVGPYFNFYDQKSHHFHITSSAGHVQEGFPKCITGIQGFATPVKFPGSFDITSPDGAD
jgi:hypothetical protein